MNTTGDGTGLVRASNAIESSGAPVIVTISGGLGIFTFTCTIIAGRTKNLPNVLSPGLLGTSLGAFFTEDSLPLRTSLSDYGVLTLSPVTAVGISVIAAVNAALAGWVAAGGSLYDGDLRDAVCFACGGWALRGGEVLPGGRADFGKTLLCRP